MRGDNLTELAQLAEAEAVAAEVLADAARARARELRTSGGAGDTFESPDVEAKTDRQATDPVVESQLPRSDRRWRGPKPVTVLAGIAVFAMCALVAAGGYLVWNQQQVDRERQSRAEFSAAAGQAVVALMSIDSSKAQDNVQRILDHSTGQFRDDFQDTAEEFVEVAKESQAVTSATVQATAIESMTGDSAVVLVSAATTITDSAGPNQQPRTWRLSVDVVRDGGQIKMSKVEFVP